MVFFLSTTVDDLFFRSLKTWHAPYMCDRDFDFRAEFSFSGPNFFAIRSVVTVGITISEESEIKGGVLERICDFCVQKRFRFFVLAKGSGTRRAMPKPPEFVLRMSYGGTFFDFRTSFS